MFNKNLKPSNDFENTENPYLNARRTWNNHVSGIVASRQIWQVVGILSLLITLSSVAGLIYIGSQSKFIPYVIEIDKLGSAVAVGQIEKAAPIDQRVVKASIAAFITDARTVTPDVALQRKAIFNVYAMLSPTDPATQKMNEWLNGSEEASPFIRAAKEMVSIEIDTVLPQTPETWQVNWIETLRDRQGVIIGKPVHMHAVVTVYIAEPTSTTTEEQLRKNPIGVYVKDFSWSKQQQIKD